MREADLSAKQHFLRLLIVGTICTLVVWAGTQILPPNDYQPSRPLYAGVWLGIAIVAYNLLRSRGDFATAVARILAWLFGVVFLATLFM